MPRSVSYQSVVDKYKYRTPIYRIVASVLCCFTFYVVVGHRPYSIYTLMFIRFQRKIIDNKWISFLFQHFSMGYNNIKTHGFITKGLINYVRVMWTFFWTTNLTPFVIESKSFTTKGAIKYPYSNRLNFNCNLLKIWW